MKSTCLLTLLISCIVLMLTSCSTNNENAAFSPTNVPVDNEITDMTAKVLFEEAANKIWRLATANPSDLVQSLLGEDITISSDYTSINGILYYKTTGSYQQLYDYYAETFTETALDWIVNTKFAKLDDTLYCSPAGGATGVIVTAAEVILVNQDNERYTYEVTSQFSYNDTIRTTNFFTVVKVNNEYRG